jgi:hypothetical protein
MVFAIFGSPLSGAKMDEEQHDRLVPKKGDITLRRYRKCALAP